MAEVEQKGKIRKWTYTGCDQIFANKPSKFEAGFGRFENFGRRIQAGQIRKYVQKYCQRDIRGATKTRPESE